MTGWQRFFLLLVFCVGVLVCWPQYDGEGLLFMGLAFVLWTCIIILFSVLVNLFAIYKLEFLHRLLSIAFAVLMLGSLLYYFPLKGGETPFSRMQNNTWPTLADVQDGCKRLTFNFDFVRRNVHRDANYVNQQFDGAAEKTQEIKKEVQKQKEKLDIIVEQLGEDK